DATKKQSGLERQFCETLREQAERNEREVVALFARIDWQVVAAGGRPQPMTRVPITYRCRRDGERLSAQAKQGWWRWEELNLRHGAYETCALPLSYTASTREFEQF